MTADNHRPLVTFYVIAFNQARFIREAIESALAQTYCPIEFVFSDDCSTDDTFEIIQEVVKGYSGPNKVILNRNERNFGLAEHVNTIMALSSGELIISADGDDIYHRQRAARCVDVWLKNGKPAALASSFVFIDAAGNPSKTKNGDQWFSKWCLPAKNETAAACLLRFSMQGTPRLITCSAAWTKEMFAAFGPMSPHAWFEDDIITLRAWLFDRIVFIEEALVCYREHDANIFNRVEAPNTTLRARRHAEQSMRIEAERRRETFLSFMPDVDFALHQRWITRQQYDEIKRHVDSTCEYLRVIKNWWRVGWIRRPALFLFLVRSGKIKDARWCARLLPWPLFLVFGAMWSRTMRRLAVWSLFVLIEGVENDALRTLSCV